MLRKRPRRGGGDAGQQQDAEPVAGLKLDCRQWFHKSSLVSAATLAAMRGRPAPKEAAASLATATSEEECLHLLPETTEGALNPSQPQLVAETSGRCDRLHGN